MSSKEWVFRNLRIYLNVLCFENLTLLFIKNGFKQQFRIFEFTEM